MSYNPTTFSPSAPGSSVRSLKSGFTNGTLSTIPALTPVSIDNSGTLTLVDVTSESSISNLVGITTVALPSAASGLVIDSGRLENITTSFSVGSALYIATDGTLTNVQPAIGVNGFDSGMFSVFVGIILKNEFNPSNKDFRVAIEVIGKL